MYCISINPEESIFRLHEAEYVLTRGQSSAKKKKLPQKKLSDNVYYSSVHYT